MRNFYISFLTLLTVLSLYLPSFAIPTSLITSVFLSEWVYTNNPSDPKIIIDAKWFSEHGMASTVYESTILLTWSSDTTMKSIWLNSAAAHRSYNLYYATGLADNNTPECDPTWPSCGEIVGCSHERWEVIKPYMIATGISYYDYFIANGGLPGINGSYHVYLNTEFDVGSARVGDLYGDKFKELYAGIVNHIYPEMPNPGTNKMVVFISPFISGVEPASCGTNLTYYFHLWLESLGDAIDLATRGPNLKLVVMLQDTVGWIPARRPGGADRTKLLNCLSDFHTAANTTKFGEDLVGKINVELYTDLDTGIHYAEWSRVQTQIEEEVAYSHYNLGASWTWHHPWVDSAAFINSWHLYYSGPTQAITFISN